MRLLPSLVGIVLLHFSLIAAEESSWSWGGESLNNFEKAGFQLNEGEDLVQAESSQQGTVQEKEKADDKQDDEELVDTILESSRQGRNLDGLDEVYADPNVQGALQKGDEPETRNIVREKLCDLGLMQVTITCKSKAITA